MTHRQTEYQKILCSHLSLVTDTERCTANTYSSAVSYSRTTDDRCFVPCDLVSLMCSFSLSCGSLCTHVSYPPLSCPPCLPPCWYGENQWLLYSVEGLMSANEILSAMSHPSDSCWHNGRTTLQHLTNITHTNMHTFMETLICCVHIAHL